MCSGNGQDCGKKVRDGTDRFWKICPIMGSYLIFAQAARSTLRSFLHVCLFFPACLEQWWYVYPACDRFPFFVAFFGGILSARFPIFFTVCLRPISYRLYDGI